MVFLSPSCQILGQSLNFAMTISFHIVSKYVFRILPINNIVQVTDKVL